MNPQRLRRPSSHVSVARTSPEGFWQRELGWLDPLFEPEKAGRHAFAPRQRLVFDVLAGRRNDLARWLGPDADHLRALLHAVAS